MKTIVIAAGYATRLYPLTENFPKPLLEIGKSTILDRLLDDIDTIPEIEEHIVVTNGKFAGIFKEWAGRRDFSTRPDGLGRNDTSAVISSGGEAGGSVISSDGEAGVEKSITKPIHIINDGTFTNETRLGAVRDLILALETFNVNEDILVVAADNILDFSLRGFVEAFRQRGTSMLMCYHEPELFKLQRTGVIEVDDDFRVLAMQEKPQEPKSHWAVPPFYIYRKEDLPLIRSAIQNGCGADAPGNLAHFLVDKTTVHAWPMPAGRFDIGSLDTYQEAKQKYK
ncbi:MAG: nucleotidyltransferase family protein [Bacteroidales bacterium]|nr:nucleotidyltransferase family protein [Bacteroidales bacterium]